MKNNYLFKHLINKEIISDFVKNDIFLSMLNIIHTGNLLLYTTCFDNLIPYFTKEKYYIAHKLISYKGKKIIIKGEMFKVSKSELLNFIQKSINISDMREFLISPISTNNKKEILYLTEDLYYLYES
ncbi:hypothetical protein GYW75_04320 [Gilliamella sp. ESL0232]|uniref:hypothetical protein n=1 Tax=Gilliamella sp. ESL0232 TaxID=2705037 RepID=UPI0015806894|nr:hypothetical protein [Gilliamella sp. ESL0232]NUE95612.1 hypothetical protein [Gilliamella sp. ESL0232]